MLRLPSASTLGPLLESISGGATRAVSSSARLLTPPRPVNISAGFPNPSLYPLQAFRGTSDATLFDSSATKENLLSMYSYPPNHGLEALREELFGLLHRRYGDRFLETLPADPTSSLFAHYGITDQLQFLFLQFQHWKRQECRNLAPLDIYEVRAGAHRVEPGHELICVIESPTFPFILPAFYSVGIRLIGCRCDEAGMRVDELEGIIEDLKMEGRAVDFVYTIPTHHNPTGNVMSLERRKSLIKLSQQEQFLILSDEAYLELTYPDQFSDSDVQEGDFSEIFGEDLFSPAPLCLLDDCATGTGTVFSLHSFSKTLAPGFRAGFVQVAEDSTLFDGFDRPTGWVHLAGSGSPVISSPIAAMIRSGAYEDWLSHLRTQYSHRLDLLCDGLQEQRGELLKFSKPNGGYFVWVTAGESQEEGEEFLRRCEEEEIVVMDGRRACLLPMRSDEGVPMRLCFGLAEEDELQEGGERLARIADGM